MYNYILLWYGKVPVIRYVRRPYFGFFCIQEDLENLSLQEEINEQSSARIKIIKVLKVKIWNRFYHQRRIMYCVFYFDYLLLKMQVQHSVLKHGACKMFEYRVRIKY